MEAIMTHPHATALAQIARQHLVLETLEARNSDALDFRDVSVWGVKAALEAAYTLGRESLATTDLRAWFHERQQIIIVWDTSDVQEIRPDLTAEQAWEVLKMVEKHHDASCGISWCSLDFWAEELFGPAPTTINA
jgi:regulator of sigma D